MVRVTTGRSRPSSLRGVAAELVAGNLRSVVGRPSSGAIEPPTKSVSRTASQLLVLMAPSMIDVLLTSVDFFVFTRAAAEETTTLLTSIAGRGCEWCVVISDELNRCAAPPTAASEAASEVSGAAGRGTGSGELLILTVTAGYLLVGLGGVGIRSLCCRRRARNHAGPAASSQQHTLQRERTPSLLDEDAAARSNGESDEERHAGSDQVAFELQMPHKHRQSPPPPPPPAAPPPPAPLGLPPTPTSVTTTLPRRPYQLTGGAASPFGYVHRDPGTPHTNLYTI